MKTAGENVLKEMPSYVADFVRDGKCQNKGIIMLPDRTVPAAKHIKQNQVHLRKLQEKCLREFRMVMKLESSALSFGHCT